MCPSFPDILTVSIGQIPLAPDPPAATALVYPPQGRLSHGIMAVFLRIIRMGRLPSPQLSLRPVDSYTSIMAFCKLNAAFSILTYHEKTAPSTVRARHSCRIFSVYVNPIVRSQNFCYGAGVVMRPANQPGQQIVVDTGCAAVLSGRRSVRSLRLTPRQSRSFL